ncbi:MAG: zinc-binding dehydrogenase, partial [Nakamurella sp.]
DPVPAAGQVLIGIETAGVNRADILVRTGKYHRAGQPPLVLGVEGAGTVLGVGPDVDEFAVGQRVVGLGETNKPGFYAEQVVVPVGQVVAVPDAVSLASAAALPTAWLSAWYCLHRLLQIQAGETVLLHAAASGVGSAAVRIAVDAGATVIATARSAEKVSWVTELGAQHALDSSTEHGDRLVATVQELTGGHGVDAVLDVVGGQAFSDSLRAIAYGGRVVAMANVALASSTIDTRDFYPKNGRIFGFQITALMDHGYDPRPDIADLLAAVATGRFTVDIDSTFPLADAAAAHRHVESRQTRGKVLLAL